MASGEHPYFFRLDLVLIAGVYYSSRKRLLPSIRVSGKTGVAAEGTPSTVSEDLAADSAVLVASCFCGQRYFVRRVPGSGGWFESAECPTSDQGAWKGSAEPTYFIRVS